MTEAIIVALIGAAAAFVVAIINKLGEKKKNSAAKTDSQKTVIHQKAKGANATQVGIKINQREDDKDDR